MILEFDRIGLSFEQIVDYLIFGIQARPATQSVATEPPVSNATAAATPEPNATEPDDESPATLFTGSATSFLDDGNGETDVIIDRVTFEAGETLNGEILWVADVTFQYAEGPRTWCSWFNILLNDLPRTAAGVYQGSAGGKSVVFSNEFCTADAPEDAEPFEVPVTATVTGDEIRLTFDASEGAIVATATAG